MLKKALSYSAFAIFKIKASEWSFLLERQLNWEWFSNDFRLTSVHFLRYIEPECYWLDCKNKDFFLWMNFDGCFFNMDLNFINQQFLRILFHLNFVFIRMRTTLYNMFLCWRCRVTFSECMFSFRIFDNFCKYFIRWFANPHNKCLLNV